MPLLLMRNDSATFSGVVPKSTRASREAEPSVVSLRSLGAENEICFIFNCSVLEGSSHPDRVFTGNEGENKGWDRRLYAGEDTAAKLRAFAKPACCDSSTFFTIVASS